MGDFMIRGSYKLQRNDIKHLGLLQMPQSEVTCYRRCRGGSSLFNYRGGIILEAFIQEAS
jgi:hypothetical protein